MKKQTELIYMADMNTITCESQIAEIYKQDDKYIIILDKTVFYPQGGGQPFDMGFIQKENNIFHVEEVRFQDGHVLHIGRFDSGRFMAGDMVECLVDNERRLLNTKLHSAGHVIDMAITMLDYGWKPVKGFHFPEGPYVEYEVVDENLDQERIKEAIENQCLQIIDSDLSVHIDFDTTEHLSGKPRRIISFGDFSVPCGGTHVSSLKEIGNITIRKIKLKKNRLKISYSL